MFTKRVNENSFTHITSFFIYYSSIPIQEYLGNFTKKHISTLKERIIMIIFI